MTPKTQTIINKFFAPAFLIGVFVVPAFIGGFFNGQESAGSSVESITDLASVKTASAAGPCEGMDFPEYIVQIYDDNTSTLLATVDTNDYPDPVDFKHTMESITVPYGAMLRYEVQAQVEPSSIGSASYSTGHTFIRGPTSDTWPDGHTTQLVGGTIIGSTIRVIATNPITSGQSFNINHVQYCIQPGEPPSGSLTISIGTTAEPSYTFTCGSNQSVIRGTTANFLLNAFPDAGMTSPVSVTLSSSPTGPALITSPVVLNSSNSYQAIAQIPTTDLTTGQTYNLTFSATNGSIVQTCSANLIVFPLNISVDIQFDNSDGPTTPSPANGSTGTLRWLTTNATACTASMVTPPSASYPAWSGSKITANSGWQTEAVTGLQQNQPYTFKLTCQNQFGESDLDTVEVSVGSPNNPVGDLECMGSGDFAPKEGPCTIPYGGSALLFFTSQYASSCSISPPINGYTPGTSETIGVSTGNLYTDGTYSLTCTGAVGTTPHTDTPVVIDVGPPPTPTANLTCMGFGGDSQSDGPCIVSNGEAGTVYWQATNVDECFVLPTPGEIDYPNIPGNASTGALSAQTVYTITCNGPGGSVTDSVTFNIQPTADLDCKPGSFRLDGPCYIDYGQSVRLVWMSTNTTACVIDNGIGSVATYNWTTGQFVSPTTTTTYTIVCQGESGTTQAVDSVQIIVNNPTVSLSCTSPISLVRGSTPGVVSITTSVSSWPGNSVDISHAFNPNSGTLPTISYSNNPHTPPGTAVVTISTTASTTLNTYTITFTATPNPAISGVTGTCNVTLIVSDSPQPTANLRCAGQGDSAPRTDDVCSVYYGNTAALYFSSQNVETCSLTPALPGFTPSPNGDESQATPALYSNTTYVLSCQGINGTGTVTDDVTINILAPSLSVSCAGSPVLLTRGQSPGVVSITTSVVGWQGGQVTISHSFVPDVSNAPDVAYSNNPQTPPSTTVATISTNGSTALGSYTLTFTASAPGVASDSCDVTVTVSAGTLPTVDLLCTSTDNVPQNGPCTIFNGATTTLTWTYANADTCSIDQGVGEVAPGNRTTQVTRTLTTTTTFRITCSGSASPPTVYDEVTVNVVTPTMDLTCAPSPVSLTPGGASGVVNVTSTVSNWNGQSISLAHSFSPNSGILPTLSYSNTQSNPPQVTPVVITAPSNATQQTYVLTFTGTATGANGDSCTVTLIVSSAPANPTVDLQCIGSSGSTPTNGPCSVISGSQGRLFWTSTNATACSLSPSISGYNPTTQETVGVYTPALSSDTTYTISCTGAVGTTPASDPVTFTIASASYDLVCAPSPVSITAGGAAGFANITSSVQNWSGQSISISHGFNPSSGILPTISYTNNPHAAPGTTTAIITAASNATIQTYTLTFTGSASGAPADSCNITLIVDPSTPLPVDPPSNVQANTNAGCGTVTVTWQRALTGQIPDYYQLSRTATVDKSGNPTDFVNFGNTITDLGLPGNPTFSVTDGSPLSLVSPNFYGVVAYKNGSPSSLVASNGVVPASCSPTLDNSDKDLTQVGNYVGNPSRCNNISDAFALSNNGLFKAGETAYFKISVCNDGNQPLTGVRITETTAFNLTNIQLFSDEDKCVTKGSDDGPYDIIDVGPGNACSIIISATITAPDNEPGALYRFWNIATIETNELADKVVSTPPFLFSIGSEPSRGETVR